MNSLNQIILEGNVVRQPEIKEFKNNFKVCEVPVAVNRTYKNADGEYVNEVSYFYITTFGQLAENCEKWCLKGRGIRVVGRLKQDLWEDANGKKNSKISIIAEHVEFKPVKKSEGEKIKNSSSSYSQPTKKSMSKQDKYAMMAEAAASAEQEMEEAVF